jgi:hypothetical protein
MDHPWTMTVAAALLVLSLGGCHRAAQDPWPVGTCVLVDDRGTAAVPCANPHTHMVIAIVSRAEQCPSDTDMFTQPADPHDGLTTTCLRSDAASE